MLIALYFFIVNVVFPQIGAYAKALLGPIMAIAITLAGIVMLFGLVGMKISNNLGTTVVSGIFRAIGYIARTMIRTIRWVIRNISRILPRVYNGSRRIFTQKGLSAVVSNILAIIVTAIVLAIII